MLSPFALETWVTFAVALPVMIARFAMRLYAPGWRGFDGTDLWCAVSTALYTIVTACNYLISTPAWPTNIELNEETAWDVPKEDYAAIERGSKVAHFSWTMYICMVFAFKGVMLSLLRRLAKDVKRQERLVFWVMIATIVAALASVLAHLLGCVPIERVWRVAPYAGATCTTRPQNYIVTGSLNMVTDAAIIAVPMPMLWNLRVPLGQKLALGFLFSSGVLVIICTILRTYYHFGDSSNQFLGQLWSGREGFISMIVISVPGMWPFFRRVGLFGAVYKKSYNSPSAGRGYASGAHASRRFHRSNGRSRNTDEVQDDNDFAMNDRSSGNLDGLWSHSEERIIGRSDSDDQGQIKVTKEFKVEIDRSEKAQKGQAQSGLNL